MRSRQSAQSCPDRTLAAASHHSSSLIPKLPQEADAKLLWCECCWSCDHDELVSECKEIVSKLNERLVCLMDERWKRLCQLLWWAVWETKVRIWRTWWIHLHTQHLGRQAAKRLQGDLPFFRLSICFQRTPGSFFRYHNISKLISIPSVFSGINRLIVCKLKPFSALRCWFRTGYVIRRWSEGLTLRLGIFSAVFLSHCCSLMWIITTNHSGRLQLQAETLQCTKSSSVNAVLMATLSQTQEGNIVIALWSSLHFRQINKDYRLHRV